MPGNLFAYAKGGKKIYVNSRVSYRRSSAIVTEIVDSQTVKIRTGAIVTIVASEKCEA
jgi:hypothetical protein